MTKFHGPVGYSLAAETPDESGIWVGEVIEFPYFGDVIRNSRRLETGEKINNDISVNNSISILADQYAIDNFFNIKYVKWAGERWTVTDVLVQFPRLILSLGSVYNGPTA